MTPDKRSSAIVLALKPHIVLTALKVSAVIGSILALINHGDKILTLSLSGTDSVKIALTYLVPYGVSTWSAVKAIQACAPHRH